MDSQIEQKIQEVLQKTVECMNMTECSVELRREPSDAKTLLVSLHTSDTASFLIGREGQNLRALEHLVRAVVAKQIKDDCTVVLDVNDYRKARATFVIDHARQAVSRVRTTQKAEVLFPMSAYERRIVHMELASYPDISTESIGDEPQRRVVVRPFST